MPNNRGRRDEATTEVVVDLFAEKRARLRRKFGALHPVLWSPEAQSTLATVTPIGAARRRRA